MGLHTEEVAYIAGAIEKKYHQEIRKSLSLRYGFLVPCILIYRRIERYLKDFGIEIAASRLRLNEETVHKHYVLHRHSSPLMRKLGDDKNNQYLQKSKITNLKIAAKCLNGLFIQPGETFSLWASLGGSPTKRKGYQQGILLSRGKVVGGIGGGLCQMSNLLYWLALHSDMEVVERHHHSLDVFKDSGRSVPFGTGATIFFPTLDLRFKNSYKHAVVLQVYVTETQLVGKLLVEEKEYRHKYHVYEEGQKYFKYKGAFYRYNRVYRDMILDGAVEKTEFLYENIFPTLYTPEQFIDIR